MSDGVTGKYVLESSENFDEFLKAIGVGFVMRNLAKVQTPTVEITESAGEYSIKTITTFKTSELNFKLDEEFEEERLDGAKVKTKVSRDGNKLVQKQFGETPCDIVREVEGDKLSTVCTVGDVVSTRIYKRV